MGKKLAIKGHPTRGKIVIEILVNIYIIVLTFIYTKIILYYIKENIIVQTIVF